MDFSQLHTYTPPQCAPENTGYTYSLRWDLWAVEEFSISATLTGDSTQLRELTQNKAKLSLRTISVFLLLILFFWNMILSTIILDTDLYVSLSCLSCFKTTPLGVLSQQFIRKHYRDQQIYHPSKLWNKRSFQVILYQCLVLVSQLLLKKILWFWWLILMIQLPSVQFVFWIEEAPTGEKPFCMPPFFPHLFSYILHHYTILSFLITHFRNLDQQSQYFKDLYSTSHSCNTNHSHNATNHK